MNKKSSHKPKIGIVIGSDTDLPIMNETIEVLKKFNLEYEVRILSAHRTPDEASEYAKTARDRGIEVIISGAGGAAHLAGSIASQTTLPVLAVPMPTTSLYGIDSLYSIVQMPAGVPVASLAIGKPGAKNAGILAAQILALKYPIIQKQLEEMRSEMRRNVLARDKKLVKDGVSSYLKSSSSSFITKKRRRNKR